MFFQKRQTASAFLINLARNQMTKQLRISAAFFRLRFPPFFAILWAPQIHLRCPGTTCRRSSGEKNRQFFLANLLWCSPKGCFVLAIARNQRKRLHGLVMLLRKQTSQQTKAHTGKMRTKGGERIKIKKIIIIISTAKKQHPPSPPSWLGFERPVHKPGIAISFHLLPVTMSLKQLNYLETKMHSER